MDPKSLFSLSDHLDALSKEEGESSAAARDVEVAADDLPPGLIDAV